MKGSSTQKYRDCKYWYHMGQNQFMLKSHWVMDNSTDNSTLACEVSRGRIMSSNIHLHVLKKMFEIMNNSIIDEKN